MAGPSSNGLGNDVDAMNQIMRSPPITVAVAAPVAARRATDPDLVGSLTY